MTDSYVYNRFRTIPVLDGQIDRNDRAVSRTYITRNKLSLTKPRDVFRRQSRSPNMVPFHMLGMHGFLLVFYSNVSL